MPFDRRKYNIEWRAKNGRLAAKRYRIRLRAAVLGFLGGACIRCGFADSRALQVDHVHGNGRYDRLQHSSSPSGYYRHILKDTTGKYQLLCANCNWIKRIENKEHRRFIDEE